MGLDIVKQKVVAATELSNLVFAAIYEAIISWRALGAEPIGK